MVLTCPYCGKTNPDYAVFCIYCGKQLVSPPQQNNPTTAPYPQQYVPNQPQPYASGEMALYFIQIAGEGSHFNPVSVILTDRRILTSKSQLLKNLAIQSMGFVAAGIIGRYIAESAIRHRNMNKVKEIASTLPPNEIIKELRTPIYMAPQLESPREVRYEDIKRVIVTLPKPQYDPTAVTGTSVDFMGSHISKLNIWIPIVHPQYVINMIYNTPLRDRVVIKR